MADSYEQDASSVGDSFSELDQDIVDTIVNLVTGDGSSAVIQSVTTLDQDTLNQAGADGVEVLQVSGGGTFNFDTLPASVKVLVFTEPVVINGQTFVGTVLLGPGNDSANFSFIQVSSTTDAGVTVRPGEGSNTVVGSGGVDTIYVGTGAQNTVNGAAGVDIVKVSGKVDDYSVGVQGGAVTAVNSATNTSLQATNSEILQFDDGVVVNAATINEAAMARLYELMFGRTPDATGMAWWMESMRAGKFDVVDAAAGFLNSPEAQTHGITPSTDNSAFLDGLYQHGLNREADAAGKQYWIDQLNSGMSQADVIASFAYSQEASVTIVGVNTIIGSI